jgi:hypothetical protein
VGGNKKKKCTKLIVLADENKVVSDIHIYSGNTHDVHTINNANGSFINVADLNINFDDFTIKL